MKPKNIAIVNAIAASLLCLHGQASAAVIYSENADGLTAGVDTLADSSNWNGNAGDYGVLAGGAIFTSNHFELTAPDANFNFANRDEGSRSVLTVSLDMADLGTSTSGDAGVRLAMRRDTGSAFRNVDASATADNTIFSYDLVINASGAPVLYEDGITSIAANTVEIWVDGALSSSVAAGGSGNVIGFGLWNRRPDNAFLADNIVIRDTAYFTTPIPEPSNLILVSLAGLIGFARRSR